MPKQDVSVIVPVYGKCDTQRLRLVLESVLWQSCIGVEAILVESNYEPTLQEFATRLRVKYCFLKHPNSEDLFSPGRVRNHGVLNSSAPLLYVTDGDVVLQNRTYLRDLTWKYRIGNGSPLRWPPMRRLPVEFSCDFTTCAERFGLAAALEMLDLPNDYVAVPRGESYMINVVKRKAMTETGQIFTTKPYFYRQYFEENMWRGLEPVIWHQVVHVGGILVSREQFHAVGGYCEKYTGWGNEDIDIQWKLSARYSVEYISTGPTFEVLHIDHDKPYLSRKTWTPNKERFEERKMQGIAASTNQDRDILVKTHMM